MRDPTITLVCGGIYLIVSAFICMEIFRSKNFSPLGGFFLGLFFGLQGIVLALIWPSGPTPPDVTTLIDREIEPRRIKCPHCAERILPEARYCHYCGREVTTAPASRPQNSTDTSTSSSGSGNLKVYSRYSDDEPNVKIAEGQESNADDVPTTLLKTDEILDTTGTEHYEAFECPWCGKRYQINVKNPVVRFKCAKCDKNFLTLVE